MAASISVFVWVVLSVPDGETALRLGVTGAENRILRGIMDMTIVIEPQAYER